MLINKGEKRIRIIGILESGHIIKVIPPDVILNDLDYRLSPENHLVVTDGRNYFSTSTNSGQGARREWGYVPVLLN